MKKFALSFKGGLARGLGAIGVIRFFQEEKLSPTVLGGSSSGAIIASAWSLGFTWEQLLDIALKINFKDISSIRSLFTEGSLVSYQKYKKKILEIHEDLDIADLPIKTVVFATDPVKNQRVFLEKGSLVEALIASSGFFPIFPSTTWHRRLLMDGDFSMGFSASKLKECGADVVLGVGHKKIVNRKTQLNFVEKCGKMFQVMFTEIESANLQSDPVDYIIAYNPKNYGLIDFKNLGKLAETAYKQTSAMKKEIFKVLEIE